MNLVSFLAVSDFCVDSYSIFRIVGYIIRIVEIVIPIIIIVVGMVGLSKAIVANDDKQIKEAQSMLIKKIIYGVLIFFVVTIVTAIFHLTATSWSDSSVCWVCATDPSVCEMHAQRKCVSIGGYSWNTLADGSKRCEKN